MNQSTAPGQSGPRHRRHVRNFLLDQRFQLKYTAYLVGWTLAVSLALGGLLWRTSQQVLDQSSAAVREGEGVVQQGRQVLDESRKVSSVVRMNITRVPDYADNPELAAVFSKEADVQDARLKAQQQTLEAQSRALKTQATELAARQGWMLWVLVVGFGLFIGLLAVMGIIITHKVAGPLFKMKRQLQQVGELRLRSPAPLRKGDDLSDFFEVLDDTVRRLRERQKDEIATLDRVLAAEDLGSERETLTRLRADKTATLG